ncbi:MAG: hypothetical protein QG670_948 [Thermoproteota archaeon]|nr:hypothetical protein [Thermoproteota archaeon]
MIRDEGKRKTLELKMKKSKISFKKLNVPVLNPFISHSGAPFK